MHRAQAAAEAERLRKLAEAEAKHVALSSKAAEHAAAAAEAEAKLAKLKALKHEMVLQLKQVLLLGPYRGALLPCIQTRAVGHESCMACYS